MPQPSTPTTGTCGRRTATRRLATSAASIGLLVVLTAACAAGDGAGRSVEAGAGAMLTSTTSTVSPVPVDLPTGAASVLETSVGTHPAADGSWRALGLVRNDATGVAGSVTVRATLVAADGHELATVTSESPVAPVRAGEPVPFEAVAPGVPASDVASVHWEAGSADAAADPAGNGSSRDLVVGTYWTRTYGDAHRLDLPTYQDPATGPHPFALYGSLANPGPGAAGVGPHALVAAWTAADGTVAALATGRATDPDGSPLTSIAPGASADVLVLVDDPVVGPTLADGTPTTWSSAR